ncbi:hypothetical protein M514_03786 [Trichuris suis]|uniref:Uncharacterized protein n=1 Tax=Trichuris suis TaxID=68888 RepID=A0A085MZN0_9BILA|nr:hypothetical protein M513_03786 [Trichuris suis]KFD62676.1 hypothetical protein M514_03786 [Trichuris suis]
MPILRYNAKRLTAGSKEGDPMVRICRIPARQLQTRYILSTGNDMLSYTRLNDITKSQISARMIHGRIRCAMVAEVGAPTAPMTLMCTAPFSVPLDTPSAVSNDAIRSMQELQVAVQFNEGKSLLMVD